MVEQQSQSYEAAVIEYNRRYHRIPPPGFQKWFEHAKANACPIIDNFDVMERDLAPFHQLSGREVMGSVEDARKSEDHKANFCRIEDGKWLPEDCVGELADNLKNVDMPNVHLPFNAIDEPRVIMMPGEQEEFWVDAGHRNWWYNLTEPCHGSNMKPRTARGADVFTHGIPLIQDHSTAIDVCQHPEYESLYGLWSAPTTLRFTRNAVPIMSPAAASTMGDIMFPAVAYNQGMYSWNEDEAVPWNEKEHGLYWAGGTTGNFVTNTSDSWARSHRQRFVLLANNHDPNKQHRYLKQNAQKGHWESWIDQSFNTDSYHAYFTNIVQCEPTGCDAEKELLAPYITSGRPRGENGKYTLVFDTDGNGHSGRYYRLLMSHSLPLKQTMLREWHDDRLIPWVHFVPVSLELEDLPEIVRYLVEEEEGRILAHQLAQNGREWAFKSLRPVDQASYVYRLALELSRLQDPGRKASVE
ncbi:unnamed protein product [Zymoseptoria tritici ST99CH_3D1]|uniref:Glycosyl transferase CAP10 domain-containing protein n=1 Tax=Zymoseptoria tritici ST99CH_1E4 TaxID=1276532 RepID=A0A2H1G6Q9_ZYMTR|nr:unnamed protein product [Zymoseptoria tritici ST99CH_1E4]SMR50425.1 unnamed protein product [Zymoseptoria tritici ST99CH_3D1]